MINDLNREDFFKTYNEFFTKLHILVKISDNERARNLLNNDSKNIYTILDKTDDPGRFVEEITKLRVAWDPVATEVFEHKEAEEVNIVLSTLERMVR